ncbi:magnesium and cobalt transport protein CorA [Candidatus Micrarchaeota archaeon CG1_02_49_24]|nr:MAG: magnesium and cobalt transport protein CorA [Candidatus Micrarchaeota archaeon CG1_02_49_24]HII53827.1 magnesium/cobalt transporter CorA [Candidatus Micrarchaeota archaeon]
MPSKLFTMRSKKAGLPPGTLPANGSETHRGVDIAIFDYDEKSVTEKTVRKIDECIKFRDSPTVTWLNVDGVHDASVVGKLGECFGVHPLVLEDIMTLGQRPKLEDFGEYVYIVLNMLRYSTATKEAKAEQVSFIVGNRFAITFQEEQQPGDVFEPVRERIKADKGLIRKMGADYLAYALMDIIVDNYFIVLENVGEQIELLEAQIVENPKHGVVREIQKLKHELIFLRKSVWPLREVLGGLERGDSRIFTQPTKVYIRDIYDHTIQIIDNIETSRDMLSGMLEIYLSSISNRLNEIMKVLTVITTIFIPLTFVAGIYGMNFRHMPELEWLWGYPAALAAMAAVAVAMLVYFRKKKWV